MNSKIRNKINETKKKIEINKAEKEARLINEGFNLFITQGINNTSVQDIVDKANVAKGTFYLYFKDKYELRDRIITYKSQKLFNDALKNLEKNYIEDFYDQFIYVINYVIDELAKNPLLLKLIEKNLNYGISNKLIMDIHANYELEEKSIYDLFINGVSKNNIKLDNPEVTFFMIVELVSSTIFSSILFKEPLPIDEYKPILYKQIRNMLKQS